jgi:L-2,4-diaminobutyric acid acetyltransferase
MDRVMTLDGITIRIANANDAQSVQAFVATCPPLDAHTAFTYWVLGNYQRHLFLIAENGSNNIVGFVTAIVSDSEPDLAYLWQIGVAERLRGSGLSLQLLDAVAEQLLRAGRTELDVSIAQDNKASNKLFRTFATSRGTELSETGSLDVADSMSATRDMEVIYRIRLGPQHSPKSFVTGHGIDPLPLFIYGNLLPGQSMGDLLLPFVQEQHPARIEASLWHHACGRFPVARPSSTDNVIGLFVTLRPEPELLGILASEELAFGYEGRWVLATSEDTEEVLGTALAFMWPWGEETVGEQIKSGKYAEVEFFQTG